MSDDNNVFENLRDDESRSEESSEIGDSTADFFVDDSEETLPGARASGQRPDDLGEVDTKEGQSVSIFNTSGPELEVRRKESGQESARQGPKDGRIQGPRQAAIWPEGMIDSRGMKMGDLDSYQGTTVSGLTYQDRGGSKRPGGGEITKAERLTDEPRAETGHLTHAMFSRTARLPPIRGSEQDGKASGLKPSTNAKILPQQSEWPKVKGGVSMEWESDDEGEGDQELSMKDQWLAEGKLLDEAAGEAEAELEEAMARCRAIAQARTAHFDAGDEGGIARTRGELARGYAQDGNLVKMLLLEAEDQEALKLRPSDFVQGLNQAWHSDVELFLRSKNTEFSKGDVMDILDKATELLGIWEKDLAAVCGDEAAMLLRERHRALTNGLMGKKGVSPLAARLFPRESAGEIMEWYLRLTSGLLEAQRLKEATRNAVDLLGGFVQQYPGPNGAIRAEPKFDGRGSLLPTSGRFAVTSVNGRGQEEAVDDLMARSGSKRGSTELKGGQDAGLMRGPESVQASRSPAEYGYDFRPGSQQLGGTGALFGSAAPVNLLGPEYMYSRRERVESRAMSEQSGHESQVSRHLGHQSVAGLSESGDSLSGFTGMDRTMIEEEVAVYVTERLAQQGNETPLTVRTLVENIPRLGLYTRKGHEASVTGQFSKAVRDLKPYSDGMFISVPQWWKRINEVGDDNGWSLPMRVRFLHRTGGLALKVHDSHRQRVIDFMRDYRDWMPHYESQRSESDHRYWLFLWMDVGIKFVQEFHTIQHPEVIEQGLSTLFKDPKYAFKSKEDPLNEDFYRVVLLYQDLNIWLVERSSDLVNSPFYVYRLMKKWLTTECGVAGGIAAGLIDKALAKLSTEPESVLPRFHGLSARELADVKQRGQGNAKADTYRLILEKLKKRATQKDLEYNATSLSQVSDLYGGGGESSWEKGRTDRKKDRKANSVVVSTDYSSLTLNTTTSAGGGSGGRPPACPSCGLFHGELKKSCPFWDPEKKLFKVKNFLEFRSVRQIGADGSSTVNDFWLKKLKTFGFRAMDITSEDDRAKIIKDLKSAAAAWPIASVEERRRYAAENKKFINLAKIEEGSLAKSSGGSKKKKPKSSKKRAKKSKAGEEDSGSSSSSGEDGEGSDSDSLSEGSGQRM
jgi:hypothetical protein